MHLEECLDMRAYDKAPSLQLKECLETHVYHGAPPRYTVTVNAFYYWIRTLIDISYLEENLETRIYDRAPLVFV